ncbi:unnamed protein product [Allacma fusca]|uniref:Uncharacterized protein n=2 Tax=Allacma fusca TaxID=39272 RepID=A0A8J2KDB2_9HEXA|nr:unnamed protein product [Allacma fusca]
MPTVGSTSGPETSTIGASITTPASKESSTTEVTTTEKTPTTTVLTTTQTTTITTPTTTEPTTVGTTTTTETPPCITPSREEIRRFHPEKCKNKTGCSRTLTEVSLGDDLMRFTWHQMNKVLGTSQNSLKQLKELFEIHLKILMLTCPSKYLDPQFITAAMELFLEFINEDFFYGVEELEASLYERVLYSLKKCLGEAEPFEFVNASGPCNTTKILPEVILNGSMHRVQFDAKESWENYEPIIESGWKLFLNAHSYCYRHFYRQNDHHSYSLKIMELFSTSIYDKWKQPLVSRYLYKFLLPRANQMDVMMDNLDYCVAAVGFVSVCPIWVDRSGTRAGTPLDEVSLIREKRNIWIGYFEENREETHIWKGKAYCLQNAEDPGYHLNFGRCSHP